MSRIHEYGHRPASLRSELNQYLSRALAYAKQHKMVAADHWAHRLVLTMIRNRILRHEDAEYLRYLDRWRRRP